MNRLRASRAFVWLALLAMAWLWLAPGVSRALATKTADAAVWAEFCTGAGTTAQTGDADAEHNSAARLHRALNHCPLCTLSLDEVAPPAANLVWTGTVCTQVWLAAPRVTAFVSLQTFLPPPRGPPAFQTDFLV